MKQFYVPCIEKMVQHAKVAALNSTYHSLHKKMKNAMSIVEEKPQINEVLLIDLPIPLSIILCFVIPARSLSTSKTPDPAETTTTLLPVRDKSRSI